MGNSAPQAKVRLTALIPCFNEEHNIEECIRSVLWADEILIVDSFSTDRTLEIARQFTDRIVQREYGYSASQKNWGIPQASHEWVLLVDSDERVTPELREEITSLLQGKPLHDGYWIDRNNNLFGKPIHFSGWGRDNVLRLFRRDVSRYEDKRVHAEIQLQNTGKLKGRLNHYTIRSITGWVAKINCYSSWKAEDKFRKGSRFPLLQVYLRPPLRFLKDYVFRLGVLDGWRGLMIAGMAAFGEFVMASKLQEHHWQAGQRRQESGKEK